MPNSNEKCFEFILFYSLYQDIKIIFYYFLNNSMRREPSEAYKVGT